MKLIYLDDTQIHSNTDNSIGMFVSPLISGLETPEIRLPSFVRPNLDGAIVPNHLYGGRLITLTGKVFADNVADYRALRRTLEEACSIKRSADGILSARTLKFTTMDDLELQVDVYTKGFSLPDRYMTSGSFKLDLFAPDLYLVGQTLNSQNIFIFEGGGMGIPMAIPMDMSVAGDTPSVVINQGNVNAYPIFTLHGPLEDPQFTNETTSEAFSIIYTMAASTERIEVDTYLRTVKYFADVDADPVNIRQYFFGDFATFAPGENTIKLTNTNFNDDAYLNVVWRDSYSGL